MGQLVILNVWVLSVDVNRAGSVRRDSSAWWRLWLVREGCLEGHTCFEARFWCQICSRTNHFTYKILPSLDQPMTSSHFTIFHGRIPICDQQCMMIMNEENNNQSVFKKLNSLHWIHWCAPINFSLSLAEPKQWHVGRWQLLGSKAMLCFLATECCSQCMPTPFSLPSPFYNFFIFSFSDNGHLALYNQRVQSH